MLAARSLFVKVASKEPEEISSVTVGKEEKPLHLPSLCCEPVVALSAHT